MKNEKFGGYDPLRHSVSVSSTLGGSTEVSFRFEPMLSDGRGILCFVNNTNIAFNVNDYHRTVVVELDFGTIVDEKTITIKVDGQMSGGNLRVTLAGIYIVSSPARVGDGGKPNMSEASGQDVRIPVPVKSTDSYVTVAFHAIGQDASDASNVFVGDPLVILVPKKTAAK
jgi:hypothetical protein